MKIHRETIIIAVMFLFALALRMYVFFQSEPYTSDTARDLSVGYHIAKFGELPTIGYLAGVNNFTYPPHYYYLVGLITLATTDPIIIMSLFMVWQTSAVITIFYIAREWFDTTTGYISTLLAAVSAYMVTGHIFMDASLMATPLFLLSFYLFIRGLKVQKLPLLYSSFFLLLAGSVLSYALLAFLPVYFLWVVLAWKPRRKVIEVLRLMAWIIVCILTLYLPLVVKYGVKTTLFAFLPNRLVTTHSDTLFSVYNTATAFIELFLPWFPYITVITLVCLSSLTVFCIMQSEKFEFVVAKRMGILWLMISLVVALTSLQAVQPRNIFPKSHVDSVVPFIIISVALSGSVMTRYLNYTWRRYVLIFLVVFLVIVFSGLFQYFRENQPYSRFSTYTDITQTILESARMLQVMNGRKDMKFFQAYEYDPDFHDWDSTKLWYLLERKLKEKRLDLVDYGNSFVQITNSDIVYLHCNDAYPQDQHEACLRDFTGDWGAYMLTDELTTLQGSKILLLKNPSTFMSMSGSE